jgi:phytoene dehydrogenase-like protein
MYKSIQTPRVVVVGAGIGGLVSALVLAHQGLDVTLVESANQPGGKIRQVQVDGVGVDSGPTVFTMKWVLDQMLESLGTSLEDMRGTPAHNGSICIQIRRARQMRLRNSAVLKRRDGSSIFVNKRNACTTR